MEGHREMNYPFPPREQSFRFREFRESLSFLLLNLDFDAAPCA
jgi:hypothetical protein